MKLRKGSHMREKQDIPFISEVSKYAGWFFKASVVDNVTCVILAHGLCGVKEMRPDVYTESFTETGYHGPSFPLPTFWRYPAF